MKSYAFNKFSLAKWNKEICYKYGLLSSGYSSHAAFYGVSSQLINNGSKNVLGGFVKSKVLLGKVQENKTVNFDKDQNNTDNANKSHSSHNNKWWDSEAVKTIAFIGTLMAIGSIVHSIYYNEKNEKLKRIEETDKKIKSELPKLMELITSDNATQSGVDKNYSNIQLVIDLYEFTSKNLDSYLKTKQISGENLLNIMWGFNALATYYGYNLHDYKKMREVLDNSKKIFDDFMHKNHLSSSSFDFDKISYEEQYKELERVLGGLTEIYTRFIYLYGRSHIYDGEILNGEPHFRKAEFLASKIETEGNRTGILEHHLSIRNGIGIVVDKKIELAIQQGDIEKARVLTQENIERYNKLQNIKVKYISDYTPHNTKSSIIDIAKDEHNAVECSERLLKYHLKLIDLTDQKEVVSYYQETYPILVNQLSGSKKTQGILKNFDHVSNRKKASICYHLGKMLLKLKMLECDSMKLEDIIKDFCKKHKVSATKLSNTENTAEELFKLCKDYSTSEEYIRADANDGLMRISWFKSKKDSNHAQRKNSCDEVKQFKQERDGINDQLQRKQSYEDDLVNEFLEQCRINHHTNIAANLECSGGIMDDENG